MIPNAVEPLSETLAVTIFRNSRPSDVRSAARHENSHQDKEGDPPHNEETHSVPFAKIGKLLFSNVLPTQQSPMPRHESLLYHDIQRSIYSLTPSAPDPAHVRRLTEFQAIEREHDVEIIIDRIPADPSTKTSSRPIKLALFDMDSTLINEEVIDELARSIGKTDIVSAITARAMNGELDFETSLRERVAMLRGVRSDVWEELKRRVTIAEGARELVRGLKENGAVVTGVVSGGFMPMAEWLKGELGLDHALANHLLTSPPTPDYPYPHLTGTLSPDHPIVTPELKRSTLLSLAEEHKVPLWQTLAVGDGSNDLLMLHAAGLGIAWNAKQRVQEQAPMRLNGKTLADLLYLFGAR